MTKPVLYLMLGYPGAGKTTAAKVIHELTGAVHIWADHERRKRFNPPTYTHEENVALYKELNQVAENLLATGASVIFDTNFNFYKDRERLRAIAARHGAQTKLLWVTTPKQVAKQRATELTEEHHTRVLGTMPEAAFDRMSSNLEPPRSDEPYTDIDGTKITNHYIKVVLGI